MDIRRDGHVRAEWSMSETACKVSKTAAVLAAAAAVLLTPVTDVHAAVFHFRAPRPSNIGLRYERYFDTCPPSPNCISSMGDVVSVHMEITLCCQLFQLDALTYGRSLNVIYGDAVRFALCTSLDV